MVYMDLNCYIPGDASLRKLWFQIRRNPPKFHMQMKLTYISCSIGDNLSVYSWL